MKKTALAIGIASAIGLAGAVAPTASATAGLHIKINNKKPSSGQIVKVKYSGARKNESYACIETLTHGHSGLGKSDGYIPSYSPVKSNSKGKGKCNKAFVSFTQIGHSCPPTKADKKAGWGCGIAIADPAHRTEYVVAKFKF